MNEPRRLKDSAGSSQRLLDSASLDKPRAASRERVAALMSTESAFSRSTSDTKPRGMLRTFAKWAAIGAAASVALAFLGSRWWEMTQSPMARELVEVAPGRGAAPPEITPESLPVVISEQHALESVRAAIERGDPAIGLQLLDECEHNHPNGALGAEALYLRILALRAAGRRAEANAWQLTFASRYPQHPLRAKIETLSN